jgi:glycosyltransferase involved in cell wall biosynthesis
VKKRATVIIPTFGNAKFARWAIKSVQDQTVKDIEICVICDGSPENMVSFFRSMEQDDPRIRVFSYPKSPRTGEPYREIVIRQTTGRIICYCSHDDLWLPDHIQVVEKALKKCWFTHTLHAYVNVPQVVKEENTLFGGIYGISLNREMIKRMLSGENYFGLTFGAHTRKCYYKLEEGWATTPRKDIATDLYMWCKFLSAYGGHCKSTMKITALNFRQPDRKDWSEQQRDEELGIYFEKIHDPAFLTNLHEQALEICPMLKDKPKRFIDNLKSWAAGPGS